ncbi:MAG: hypothetical protein OEZ10_05650 [Gammaproteobacteria bacterium]|nr:hypothetical protein [Gammaproteobacteria bacterium]
MQLHNRIHTQLAMILTMLGTTLFVSGCGHDTRVTSSTPLPTLERSTTVLSDNGNGTLTVPRSGIVSRNGTPGVFVFDNGQARFRMIRPGKVHGDQQQVLSGLNGSETLVTGSLNEVRDGSPITVAR